jgi:hypothetical protein
VDVFGFFLSFRACNGLRAHWNFQVMRVSTHQKQ